MQPRVRVIRVRARQLTNASETIEQRTSVDEELLCRLREAAAAAQENAQRLGKLCSVPLIVSTQLMQRWM